MAISSTWRVRGVTLKRSSVRRPTIHTMSLPDSSSQHRSLSNRLSFAVDEEVAYFLHPRHAERAERVALPPMAQREREGEPVEVHMHRVGGFGRLELRIPLQPGEAYVEGDVQAVGAGPDVEFRLVAVLAVGLHDEAFPVFQQRMGGGVEQRARFARQRVGYLPDGGGAEAVRGGAIRIAGCGRPDGLPGGRCAGSCRHRPCGSRCPDRRGPRTGSRGRRPRPAVPWWHTGWGARRG